MSIWYGSDKGGGLARLKNKRIPCSNADTGWGAPASGTSAEGPQRPAHPWAWRQHTHTASHRAGAHLAWARLLLALPWPQVLPQKPRFSRGLCLSHFSIPRAPPPRPPGPQHPRFYPPQLHTPPAFESQGRARRAGLRVRFLTVGFGPPLSRRTGAPGTFFSLNTHPRRASHGEPGSAQTLVALFPPIAPYDWLSPCATPAPLG